MCEFLRKYRRFWQSTTINLYNHFFRYLLWPLFMPLPPPRFEAPLYRKKAGIPKDAIQFLREAASSDEKTDESSSDSYTDEPANKLEASKKKPKTHFRKTKKPGRA